MKGWACHHKGLHNFFSTLNILNSQGDWGLSTLVFQLTNLNGANLGKPNFALEWYNAMLYLDP
jgi:hypothetical protein